MNIETIRQIVRQELAAAGVGGGDSYSPLPLRVSEDGRVEYEFDGKISARGVDLLAAEDTGEPLQVDRMIRWLDRDNDPRSVIYAYRDITNSIAILHKTESRHADEGGGSANAAHAVTVTRGGSSYNEAALGLTASAYGPGAEIILGCAEQGTNSVTRRLLDSKGRSDFVQKSDIPQMCRALRSGSQSIPTSSGTFVALNAKQFDNAGMYQSPNNYVKVPADGVYAITGNVWFAANPYGGRGLDIHCTNPSDTQWHKASTTIGVAVSGSTESYMGASAIVPLKSQSRIRIVAYQFSGGDLALTKADLTVIRLYDSGGISVV